MTYAATYTVGSLPAVQPIVHYRRDTFVFVFDICEDDPAETPIDLTGSVFKMQVRKERSGDLVATVGTASGEVTLPSPGRVRIQFTPEQTADLPTDCKLVYDIQQTLAGVVKTYLRGSFEVINDVTT